MYQYMYIYLCIYVGWWWRGQRGSDEYSWGYCIAKDPYPGSYDYCELWQRIILVSLVKSTMAEALLNYPGNLNNIFPKKMLV